MTRDRRSKQQKNYDRRVQQILQEKNAPDGVLVPQVAGQSTTTTSVTPSVTFNAMSWQGPLPPPEALRAYEDSLPGAAERIIAMTERQSAHRQALEAEKLEGDRRAETRGQYLTAALAALVFGGSGFLIYVGKDLAGGVAIIAQLIALVKVYLEGRKGQSDELARKRS